MSPYEKLEKARVLLDYLCPRSVGYGPADLIIGFGHFDMRIPERCGDLYRQGLAPFILFTGGRGAGSADLQEAEGIAFLKHLKKTRPDIPEDRVIVESESTNTGENISFSEKALIKRNPEFSLGNGIKSVIAVATPGRQKRVFLALCKNFPQLLVINAPPLTTLEEEIALYKGKGEDFISLLLGEMERIKTYPKKGFIAYEKIPDDIEQIFSELKNT